ncbi:SUMO-interacting motif-containing protein 1 isoform X1 [Solea solea]|uniref:SUMO-interacting motif-containing protein 1 isoform X1 n=1 Tax=Solea solea TaxID=90069 RepID=UPI00272A525E|nr:SUMO-interacting motif-containing protein 1 isoform X1 [Solea solea]
MDDVICLSSGESDVEIVESSTETEPLLLTSLRVDVNAASDRFPPCFIHHPDSRRTSPHVKIHKNTQTSEWSSCHSSSTRLNPSDLKPIPHKCPVSHDLKSQVHQTPTSRDKPAENIFDCELDTLKVERASKSPGLSCCSVRGQSPTIMLNSENRDEAYCEFIEMNSPPSSVWHDENDDGNEESRFDLDFRAASQEDRHFVCPVTLRKIMSRPCRALTGVEDDSFGPPQVLCRQNLSLVYIAMEENYPEGTLQLLSDLLQPGYYPPKDITTHLLHNILLNPQYPHQLCVQAFNLLMRTQRHHIADKNTVPWEWEMVTTVMANQDSTKRRRWEVVRMFLDYVVQTLEDDFHAKLSMSALPQSITKCVLSCDQQFPQVRNVTKWLFSAIMNSVKFGESKETTRERDEQTRMVSIFQRMLSLAVEVDCSPTLSSLKLSQELFHVVISNVPLRAYRMLLLESLQVNQLRSKLLELLLDYSCPQKIFLPMSLSLLLHFMKNCTLAPDPMDGTERWQRWEELVHLLWMLLLSYNKAMRGYLCSSVSEQRGSRDKTVYRPHDKVSKSAIHEAVNAFQSRSQADIGNSLPPHVEESLTYLQDHLLDICQC